VKFRNTLLALLVLTALGAFIYFYEYKGESEREKAQRDAKSLLVFERDQAAGFELQRPGEAAIALVKEADHWRLTSPVAARADDDKVSSLLSTLGFLQVDEEIPDVAPGDLEGFGLGAGAVRLAVKSSTSDPVATVFLGGKTAVGGSHYARRDGAGSVLVISGGADQVLSSDLASLRYKKVVGVDSFKLKRFQIDRGSERLAVSHQDSDWRLELPQPFPADSGKAQGLWFDMQSWEAESFAVESPAAADLAAHGLDRPLMTLTVEAQEQAEPLRVTFGRTASSSDLFAQRSDTPSIMKVKSETYDKIIQSMDAPMDLRDARVAPVDRWQVDSVEIVPSGAGQARLLVKDSEAKWRWGAADGPEMPEEQVSGLLDAIEGLKATGYIDRPAASDQRETVLNVTLREAGEGTPVSWSFKIGVQGAQDGDTRRVVASAATPIYLVPGAGAASLIEKSLALSKPEPQAAQAPADPNSQQPVEH